MLILILASVGTALATGLGAIPVFVLGERAKAFEPILLGVASGAMTVAAIAGLLAPGLDEGSVVSVGAGVIVGVLFLVAARRILASRGRHAEVAWSKGFRTSLLVFVVLSVHSLPEGFAIGTAYASDTAGLSLFVVVAIAVQNIPEGTSIAVPMAAASYSPWRQFCAAVATSAPQPVGAVIAYLLVSEISSLLPLSFGFAAGAMLALVATELVPQAFRDRPAAAAIGVVVGAAAMAGLSTALGV